MKKRPLTPAEKMARLRERRREAGLCLVCGQRKARRGKVTCAPCSERAKAIVKASRAKR